MGEARLILKGDCIEVLKAMKSNSVDAVVTDPPYGLEFMGKEWDRLGISKHGARIRPHENYRKFGGYKDAPDAYVAGTPMQLWHTQWLTQAYRVLKPGGSMLVMGGTRTFHRLACAIEDSGFIIKDTLMWLYGSGFPKAQDLGKMIDKRNGRNPCQQFKDYLNKKRIEKKLNFNQINEMLEMAITGGGTASSVMGDKLYNVLPTLETYKKLKEILSLDDRFDKLIEREEAEREKIGEKQAGIGSGKTYAFTEDNIKAQKELDVTAPSTDLAKHWDGFKVGGIKPAYEPIVWAVKPPEGSYIDNVLKWGVGAVNVDKTRISLNGEKPPSGSAKRVYKANQYTKEKIYGENKITPTKGRFPANVILSHHPECVQDRCHLDCPVRMLDEQSKRSHSSGIYNNKSKPHENMFGIDANRTTSMFNDSGGASRFFYCAKASRSERNRGLEGAKKYKQGNRPNSPDISGRFPDHDHRETLGNNHPTVKPIALFEWLIKLVTRKGQVILDPFLGSGTTAISAHNTGRKCIGIEREDEYLEIAKRRVDYWKGQPKQMEMRI